MLVGAPLCLGSGWFIRHDSFSFSAFTNDFPSITLYIMLGLGVHAVDLFVNPAVMYSYLLLLSLKLIWKSGEVPLVAHAASVIIPLHMIFSALLSISYDSCQ